uniref:Spermidine/spermine N1-acetyltransferase family member 2 n=1 Tax=Neolamprologus brichardi TaxID=32507 RepID=A0A3Q4IGB0_NEOBR
MCLQCKVKHYAVNNHCDKCSESLTQLEGTTKQIYKFYEYRHGLASKCRLFLPVDIFLPSGHTKVGYALYFYSYSSFVGRAIYMEDLYVMPEFRGKGVGKALMSKVAQLALAAGCHQLNFTILNWNKPSMDFYLSQGCFDITATMGYHCMRCEGEALKHLAQF